MHRYQAAINTTFDSLESFWNRSVTRKRAGSALVCAYLASLAVIELNRLGLVPGAVAHTIPVSHFSAVRSARPNTPTAAPRGWAMASFSGSGASGPAPGRGPTTGCAARNPGRCATHTAIKEASTTAGPSFPGSVIESSDWGRESNPASHNLL